MKADALDLDPLEKDVEKTIQTIQRAITKRIARAAGQTALQTIPSRIPPIILNLFAIERNKIHEEIRTLKDILQTTYRHLDSIV